MGYDLAGNLTDDSYTGAGARVYDAENWMPSAVIGINSSATYTYDADGRRPPRQTPTENVWQVYGIEGEVLAEYAANGAPASPQKEYGYRNGELLITASGGANTYMKDAILFNSSCSWVLKFHHELFGYFSGDRELCNQLRNSELMEQITNPVWL